MNLKNLGFRATTMLGFCTIIALFSAILIFSTYEFWRIRLDATELEQNVMPYELLADQMAFDVVQVQQFLTDVSATRDRDGFTDAEKYAKDFRESINTMKSHYASNPEKIQSLEQITASFDTYYETGKHMAEIYIAEGGEAGTAIMKQPQTGFDAVAVNITTKMAAFRNKETGSARAKVQNVATSSLRANWISLIAGFVSIISGLGLGWRISGSLLGTLGIEPMYAKGIAKEIAKGDLTRDIALSEGDNSSLLFAIKSMQLKLREMVREVSSNAIAIVSSAQLLAESAQSVLSSSQRQDTAATSVASAVEEMTTSIHQIADNAEHSDKIAKQAGIISEQGGQVVSDAVEEMNLIASSVHESSDIIRHLGDSSRRISDIVNVIKDIADQTNLLALNAAIEAARAGEQGRGFAVVADEVRNLAARTAQATQEISTMVGEIQKNATHAVVSMEQGAKRVSDGVEKARLAGASMAQIKDGTEQVVQTVAGITNAIKHQNSAISSVAGEVEMIAHMVSENTAAVDRLASTSVQLNQLADQLNKSINNFKA